MYYYAGFFDNTECVARFNNEKERDKWVNYKDDYSIEHSVTEDSEGDKRLKLTKDDIDFQIEECNCYRVIRDDADDFTWMLFF